MSPTTFYQEGHVRIDEWPGRQQPFTVRGGDAVWHFASHPLVALRYAEAVKKQLRSR